jgi:hypothetical protein
MNFLKTNGTKCGIENQITAPVDISLKKNKRVDSLPLVSETLPALIPT